MFDQIFGNFLVETGKITKEQLADVIAYESTVRVKLGLIAVAEKLLTNEQADEINQLQAIMDKRFGDIAVEKGYLTEDQVSNLLKKQGNIYMVFVQTLIDKKLMTLERKSVQDLRWKAVIIFPQKKPGRNFGQRSLMEMYRIPLEMTIRWQNLPLTKFILPM